MSELWNENCVTYGTDLIGDTSSCIAGGMSERVALGVTTTVTATCTGKRTGSREHIVTVCRDSLKGGVTTVIARTFNVSVVAVLGTGCILVWMRYKLVTELGIVIHAVIHSYKVATYTFSYNVTVLGTCRRNRANVYAEVVKCLTLCCMTGITGLGSGTSSICPIVTECCALCCMTYITGLGSSAGCICPIVTERIALCIIAAITGSRLRTGRILHIVAKGITNSMTTTCACARAGSSTSSLTHYVTGYVVLVTTVTLGVLVTGFDNLGVMTELISVFHMTYGAVSRVGTGSLYPYVVSQLSIRLLT